MGETNLLESSVGCSGYALNHGLDELGKDGRDALPGVSEKVNDEIAQEQSARFRLAWTEKTSDHTESGLETCATSRGVRAGGKEAGGQRSRVEREGEMGRTTGEEPGSPFG